MLNIGMIILINRGVMLKYIKYVALISLLLLYLAGCQNSGNQLSNSGLVDEAVNNAETTPPEYSVLLDDLKRIVIFRLSEGFEAKYNDGEIVSLNGKWAEDLYKVDNELNSEKRQLKYHWHCMLVDMIDQITTPSVSSFGYILKDIDGDQFPEVFFVTNDYQILALFSIKNKQVCLVDAYWPKHECVLLDSGELCTLTIANARTHQYEVAQLNEETDTSLSIITVFGSENEEYYEGVGQDKHPIDSVRYMNLCEAYPFAPSNGWRSHTIYPLD